ncbi:MAG: hypothetical protein ACREJ5_03425 [Geminicoccaceae bacterium]
MATLPALLRRSLGHAQVLRRSAIGTNASCGLTPSGACERLSGYVAQVVDGVAVPASGEGPKVIVCMVVPCPSMVRDISSMHFVQDNSRRDIGQPYVPMPLISTT